MTSAGRSFAASAAKGPCACAPCSSVRGSWQRDVDPAAASKVLQHAPLARDGPKPVATRDRHADRRRASVGETVQATEAEACSGREVVETEAERYRAGGGSAGAGERLRVVAMEA